MGAPSGVPMGAPWGPWGPHGAPWGPMGPHGAPRGPPIFLAYSCGVALKGLLLKLPFVGCNAARCKLR